MAAGAAEADLDLVGDRDTAVGRLVSLGVVLAAYLAKRAARRRS